MPINININFAASVGSLMNGARQVVQSFQQMSTAVNTLNTRMGTLAATSGRALASMSAFGSRMAAAGRVASTAFGVVGASAGGLVSAVGRIGAAAAMGFGGAGRAASSATGHFRNHNSVLNVSVNAYKGLVGQVVNLNRFLNVTFAAIRQIGQGLQNFGTVFSIFISAPITALFGGIVKEAMDFDHQMIEVRKTTGLMGQELEKVEDRLNNISTMTPTLRVDLAAIAADWGRMGATSPDLIAQLTEATDKIVLATDLTAQNAVEKFGRLGTLLFRNLDEFNRNFLATASAVNELGQANPIGETELIDTALRMAPAARMVGMNPQDILGFAASVSSVAASSQLAGTETSSAITMTTKNLEKYAAVLGLTEEQTKSLIDQDIVGFFTSILTAVSQLESKTDQSRILQELMGTVGAKATGGLIANLPNLERNLDLANKSFAEGTSIQKEYERSLDSVKNQVGILRNNLVLLGNTFAEIILPYITKFVALAVPALTKIREAFDQLSEKTKLMIIGFGLLMAVLGPIIIMVGTFLFSLGIIGTGISTFIANILNAALSIGKFGLGILGVISPMQALIGLLVAGGGAAIYFAAKATAATSVVAQNIMAVVQYVNGLIGSFLGGIGAIFGAFSNLINVTINQVFGLFSDLTPRQNPLLKSIQGIGAGVKSMGSQIGQTITQGLQSPSNISDAQSAGEAIGDAIAEGIQSKLDEIEIVSPEKAIQAGLELPNMFRDALRGLSSRNVDLFGDIFGDARGIINNIASALANNPDFDLRNWVKELTGGFVNFFETLENGGNASLGGLQNLLGSFTQDFEHLIELEYEYVRVNERLEEVKKSIDDIDADTDKRIRAVASRTDLTLEQRSAMIRGIKLEAEQRRIALEEEKKTLEDEKDTAKERVDNQKSLIDILSSLVMPAEPNKKIKEDKPGDFDNMLAGTLPATDKIDDISNSFGGATEQTAKFIEQLSRAQEIVNGFIAGIRGEVFDKKQWAELSDGFHDGFRRGKTIRDEFIVFMDALNTHIKQVQDGFNTLKLAIRIFLDAVEDGFKGRSSFSQYLDGWRKFVYDLGYTTGQAGQGFVKIGKSIEEMAMKITGGQPFLDWFVEKWTLAAGAIVYVFNTILSVFREITWERIRIALGSIIKLFGGLGLVITDTAPLIGAIVGGIAGGIAVLSVKAVALLGVISELLLMIRGIGDAGDLRDNLQLLFGEEGGNVAFTWGRKFIEDVKWVVDWITTNWGGLVDWWNSSWDEVGNRWDAFIMQTKHFVVTLASLWIYLQKAILGVWDAIKDFVVWIAPNSRVAQSMATSQIESKNRINRDIGWRNKVASEIDPNVVTRTPVGGWEMPLLDVGTPIGSSGGGGKVPGKPSLIPPGSMDEGFDFGQIFEDAVSKGIDFVVGSAKVAESITKMAAFVAKSVWQGVVDWWTGQDGTDKVGGGIKTGLQLAQIAITNPVGTIGMAIAVALGGGFSGYYDSEEGRKETFDPISDNADKWSEQKKTDLESTGKKIGVNVKQGVKNELNEVGWFQNAMITAMNAGLSTLAFVNSVLKIGFDVGVSIIKGITSVLVQGATYVWDAFIASLTNRQIPPFQLKFEPLTAAPQSIMPGEKYMPDFGAKSGQAQDSFFFDIDISGGNLNDRAAVKYIIDEVYAKVSADLRLAKARG